MGRGGGVPGVVEMRVGWEGAIPGTRTSPPRYPYLTYLALRTLPTAKQRLIMRFP